MSLFARHASMDQLSVKAIVERLYFTLSPDSVFRMLLREFCMLAGEFGRGIPMVSITVSQAAAFTIPAGSG
jgi:hypothetical protein